MGPLTSPIVSILGRNRPGTPESRAEERTRQANAGTSIPGYRMRPAGTSTLTGGLEPDVGQKL